VSICNPWNLNSTKECSMPNIEEIGKVDQMKIFAIYL